MGAALTGMIWIDLTAAVNNAANNFENTESLASFISISNWPSWIFGATFALSITGRWRVSRTAGRNLLTSLMTTSVPVRILLIASILLGVIFS